jgi:SSS family solute:Na+ symporter
MARVNFLHFAVLLFAVCTAVLVGVSLLTAAPPSEKTAALTYRLGGGAAAQSASPARRINVALSVLLAATVGVVWVVFR